MVLVGIGVGGFVVSFIHAMYKDSEKKRKQKMEEEKQAMIEKTTKSLENLERIIFIKEVDNVILRDKIKVLEEERLQKNE